MPELGETEMRLPPFHVAARSSGVLPQLHRISRRHPEWWMMLLAAAAWAFLIVWSRSPTGHGGASPGVRAAILGGMVIAMMLPLTAGRVREMARSTAAPFGHRAAVSFVSSYLAVWMLAMFAIDAAWRLTISAAGLVVSTGIVIASAVIWEVALAKWRQWHGGPQGAGSHVHESGMERRIDAGGIQSGAAAGASCVVSCWAQMAVCVAFAHSLPVMAAFFLVQLYGRYRRPASPVVAALAILGVCLVSLAFRIAGHQHHPHM